MDKQDKSKICSILTRLDEKNLSLEIQKITKVGRFVNTVVNKPAADPAIVDLGKCLLLKWRKTAAGTNPVTKSTTFLH